MFRLPGSAMLRGPTFGQTSIPLRIQMERDNLVGSLLAHRRFAAWIRGDDGPLDALAAAIAGCGRRLAAPASAWRIAVRPLPPPSADGDALLDVLSAAISNIETIAVQDTSDDERLSLERVGAAITRWKEASRAKRVAFLPGPRRPDGLDGTIQRDRRRPMPESRTAMIQQLKGRWATSLVVKPCSATSAACRSPRSDRTLTERHRWTDTCTILRVLDDVSLAWTIHREHVRAFAEPTRSAGVFEDGFHGVERGRPVGANDSRPGLDRSRRLRLMPGTGRCRHRGCRGAKPADPFTRAWQSFTSPTAALPVDAFRVLVGLLSCGYFLRTLHEAPAISDPDGLIDHDLVRHVFWFTRIGLFHPRLGAQGFQAIYLAAAGASLLLAAGIAVKPAAGFLYLTAVSTYRWNFPVTYLDDTTMHLMLLWMLLLPVGRTLTLPELLAERGVAFERWQRTRVPGATVRCFQANLALLYVVAGLWKWSSPLWRQGLAVYAGLKMAVAHAPDRWQPAHLPMLRLGDYLTLVLEPLFPVAFVLPADHPLKRFLSLARIGFHLGIVATLKIPFSNLACIAAETIVSGDEFMRWFGSAPLDPEFPAEADRAFDVRAKAASALVGLLTLAMISDALKPCWRSGTHPAVRAIRNWADQTPGLRTNPLFGLLWFFGVAQSYRLFDWVDERNYHITYEMTERRSDGSLRRMNPETLFPRTQRNILLQSYLHDVMWMKVPRRRLPDLQRSLFARYAQRFCRTCGDTGRIEVVASVQRTTGDNLDLRRPDRRPFVTFTCRDGTPDLRQMRLSTE
jgi:hypothetical protein